ncbi:MAG: rhodanese-like domain-containing protein [Thermoleophilaceae bacterium]
MPEPIDYPALRELLDQGAQLVEVLPVAEYEEVHLPRAVNLPLKKFDRESAAGLDPGRPVAVYCHDAL